MNAGQLYFGTAPRAKARRSLSRTRESRHATSSSGTKFSNAFRRLTYSPTRTCRLSLKSLNHASRFRFVARRPSPPFFTILCLSVRHFDKCIFAYACTCICNLKYFYFNNRRMIIEPFDIGLTKCVVLSSWLIAFWCWTITIYLYSLSLPSMWHNCVRWFQDKRFRLR